MNEDFQIASFCCIRDNRIVSNGKTIFESSDTDFTAFIKSAYKNFEIDHSKFFKMDGLSKLAFTAAEILLKDEKEKDVALVFSNTASSLDTDRKHQESIEDVENYYPSPAIFVYTLPNICMGEISIRHGLHSENAFFVFEEFNPSALQKYTQQLLTDNCAKKAVCGWVDLDKGKYDAFLYVVAKNGTFAHTTEELTRLYKTI